MQPGGVLMGLPDIRALEDYQPSLSTRVFDSKGDPNRSGRPSCVGAFLRLRLCGTINLMPRSPSRSRSGSLS